MSSLKVEVVRIDDILPHPNADRLEIAQIAGWQCVVQKNLHVAGEYVIYIPINSVLSPRLESYLFKPDSKVKLSKSRVKTIKLRGAISQGILITLDDYQNIADLPRNLLKVGDDVAFDLGITKYEPPVRSQSTSGNEISKKLGNPQFHKYTDIENFKHYNTLFEPGELVYITEKMHGTSARYGWLPAAPNTLWKKVKKFFDLLPEREFCLGSRNVQLQDKKYNGFYPTDVYSKIATQLNLKNTLEASRVSIYGEIVGTGIQGGYTYGCEPGEHKLYVYDISIDGVYVSPNTFIHLCDTLGLTRVPILYIGPYSQEKVDRLKSGDSTVGGQKVREGIVIKPMEESSCYIGRKVLKCLNDDYLLGEQTDFH